MGSSSGNSRVDQIALEAARQWKFRPATVNSGPVLSYERLEVEVYPAS